MRYVPVSRLSGQTGQPFIQPILMQRLIHSRFHGMLLGSRVYVPQMSTIKCINGFGYYVHWIVVTLIRYTDAFGFMESFMTCNITLPLMPMVWSTPIDLGRLGGIVGHKGFTMICNTHVYTSSKCTHLIR